MAVNPNLKKLPKEWLAEPAEIQNALDNAAHITARYQELFGKPATAEKTAQD